MKKNLAFQLLFMLLMAASPGPLTRGAAPCLPEPPLPESWQYEPAQTAPMPADDPWWRDFDDPVLDSLITMAESANYDVAMAMHRMEAARQQMRVARAAYFPQIGLSGSYTRSRQDGLSMDTYSVAADASWEIDIFGRITAQVRQERATYRASRAEWAGMQVSVAAELASTYMQLRVWQAELDVALQHISRQDTIAGIADTRFQCGLNPKTDVDQARGILYSTKATVPTLRTSIRQAVNAIGLLTASYASEIQPLLDSRTGLPDYGRLITTGVPAEILRRRPDVVQAEQQLAAAAAAVGIAKKDFLPTLSINGSVGYHNHGHGKFFSSDRLAYSVAPTLTWTLFDGMARSARAAAAREQEETLVEQYRYTVMNAYNEVDNALTAYREAVRAIADLERAEQAAAEFMRLSLELYTQGLTDFTDVANAQVSYLDYTNSLITARGNALSALVSLYKALGGGYTAEL